MGHSAVLTGDGSVLIAGGAVTALQDLFRPTDFRGGFTAMVNVSRSPHSTNVMLSDGRIAMLTSISGTTLPGSLDLLNPETGAFSSAITGNHPLGTAIEIAPNTILHVGGTGVAGDTAEVITVGGGSVPTPPLSVPRAEASLARLPDGRVLVMGGYKGASTFVYQTAVDIYDPVANTFATLPGATVGYGASTTITEDSRVLVIGGRINGSASRAVLEFDPASSSFTQVATLKIGRYTHSATVLDARRILLIGGVGEDVGAPGYIGSVELLDIVTAHQSSYRGP